MQGPSLELHRQQWACTSFLQRVPVLVLETNLCWCGSSAVSLLGVWCFSDWCMCITECAQRSSCTRLKKILDTTKLKCSFRTHVLVIKYAWKVLWCRATQPLSLIAFFWPLSYCSKYCMSQSFDKGGDPITLAIVQTRANRIQTARQRLIQDTLAEDKDTKWGNP